MPQLTAVPADREIVAAFYESNEEGVFVQRVADL
jgi:hypothetical protein